MSADFDKAIDRAVRDMLDVEPPAGLRHRVLEQLPAFAEATAGKPADGSRLPASSFRLPASGWALGAAAAAALIVLAVFLTRGTPRQLETTTVSVPQPAPAPAPTTAVQLPDLTSAQVQVASGQPRIERRVVAAAAPADVTFDAPPAPGFPRLPALSVPELSVSSIQRVAPVEGPDAIATDPIATPSPLAIEPLPAQGRQSQE